jgi:hypothetical protein
VKVATATLLLKAHEGQSRIISDSFRVFLGAVGGAEAAPTSVNVRNMVQLCAEFHFAEFAKPIPFWQSVHYEIDPIESALYINCPALAQSYGRHGNHPVTWATR